MLNSCNTFHVWLPTPIITWDSGHAQVCKSLRFSGVSVPRDYEQGFQRALWTFQHQRVWCPHRKQLVHLRPLPAGGLAAGDSHMFVLMLSPLLLHVVCLSDSAWVLAANTSRSSSRCHRPVSLMMSQLRAVWMQQHSLSPQYDQTSSPGCMSPAAYPFATWYTSRWLTHDNVYVSRSLLGAVDAVAGALLDGDTAHDFLGPVQPDEIMQQVAEGNVPITHCVWHLSSSPSCQMTVLVVLEISIACTAYS